MNRFVFLWTLATLFLGGCVSSTNIQPPIAATKADVIKSDTFYVESEDIARQVRTIYKERFNIGNPVVVGSADKRDYVGPKIIKKVRPKYPKNIGISPWKQSVVVEGIVDSGGDVIAVRIVRSTDQQFERAALDALKQWKFYPKLYKNVPVISTVSQPIEFSGGSDVDQ